MKLPEKNLRILIVAKTQDRQNIIHTKEILEWFLAEFQDYVM